MYTRTEVAIIVFVMTINALRMLNLRARGRTGGDCVVLALTFITGASYLDVEDIIKQHHSRYMAPESKRAHGVYTERVLRDKFKLFGFTLKKIPLAPNSLSVDTFKRVFPDQTYLVCIHRHAFVVQNGEQFDAGDSSGKCLVRDAWIAEKDVAVAA